MSSQRTRVAAIFVVIAAVFGGAAFWFFKIYSPRQVRVAAQGEIAGWEARWAAARECLLGTTPPSVSTAETLAVGVLAGGDADKWRACTAQIGNLSRDNETDSGVAPIEAAWDGVAHAVGKVAQAFGSHVDPGGERRDADDPLGPAIDALDAADATLRAAADLPVTAVTGARLPAAKMIAVEDHGTAITTFDPPIIASGHGILGFAKTKAGGDVQLEVVGGRDPVVTPVGAGVAAGVPDPSWGAIAEPNQLRVGAFAADRSLPAQPILPLPGNVNVLAFVGSAGSGSVVYGAGDHLMVASTTAAGSPFTAAPPVLVDRMAYATDAALGTTAVVWSDHAGALHGAFVHAGTGMTKPIDLGNDQPDVMCVTGDRAWLRTARAALVTFDPTSAVPPLAMPDATLRACAPDGAIFTTHGTQWATQFIVCASTCRPVTLWTRASLVTTTYAGRLVGFAASGGVIGVWIEGSAKAGYLSVPTHFTPLAATTDGKVFDVLGKTPAGLAIARMPVR